MMKRPIVIIAALVIGITALWFYSSMQLPAGIEAKGDDDALTLRWLTLAISIISLLTGIAGLIQKILELRAAGGDG